VDLTQIEENLKLTPTERIETMQRFQRFLEEAKRAVATDLKALIEALIEHEVAFVIVGGNSENGGFYTRADSKANHKSSEREEQNAGTRRFNRSQQSARSLQSGT
jgi:hypothetical protein